MTPSPDTAMTSPFPLSTAARLVGLVRLGRCRAAMLAAGAIGCGNGNEYAVVVRDPHLVTLRDDPTPARVEDGAPILATGTHDGAPWTLVVFRESDGALRLRCTVCNADAILVGADRVMHVWGSASARDLGLERPPASDESRDALVALPYRYCGFPTRHACRDAAWEGTRVTPWSNVAEIRVRNGTSYAASPATLVLAAGFAALGGLFLAGLASDRPAVRVGGVIGAGGTWVLSGAFVTAFVDSNRGRVIDSGAPR